MQWWEVNRYLTGLHRRYHPTYESARMLQWFLACMFNDSKKHAAPQSPQDLYKFGWEEEQQITTSQEITDEDQREFDEMMRDYKMG